MAKIKKYQQRLREQDCCIVVPTYNNVKTLSSVLYSVMEYSSDIIVVNDGSTDRSEEILKQFPLLKLISFEKNQGKGAAMRAGFKAAEALGFEYAITIDSDGQHYASDIVSFLETLENHQSTKPLLLIGSRKMDHKTVPAKSSIGNKLSTFWYKVETGIQLEDTQCGYRLYPVRTINKLNLVTSRFEFEIEVIVKAAWSGVEVRNIPVKVLYDENERVTHFRPWNDTARIAALNSWFVLQRSINLFSKKKKVLPKS